MSKRADNTEFDWNDDDQEEEDTPLDQVLESFDATNSNLKSIANLLLLIAALLALIAWKLWI